MMRWWGWPGRMMRRSSAAVSAAAGRVLAGFAWAGGAGWFWCGVCVESDVSVLDGTDQCEDLPHREGFPLVSRGQVLT